MSRNAQALILLVTSQISWLVCCAASVPAFRGVTYVETTMRPLLILNGLLIIGSGTGLILLAILVKAQKEDTLSSKKLSPFFNIGMGVTAFMLIAQVILAVSHAHVQPDESDFVAPEPSAVEVFQFDARLEDGRDLGGGAGFVIEHPIGSRPVFVTTIHEFGPDSGNSEWMTYDAIYAELDFAVATQVGDSADLQFTLGEPIDFKQREFFSWWDGAPSVSETTLFFEAPGMEEFAVPRALISADNKPSQQLVYAVGWDLPLEVHELRYGLGFDDFWDTEAVEEGIYISSGTPVLNFEHQVLGMSTGHLENGDVRVVPMTEIYDYLGGRLQ